MKPETIEVLIASRRINLDGEGSVEVRIGMPRRLSDSEEEYSCPYQILGIGSGRVKSMIGMDAIQALKYALQAIGVDLYTSDEAKAGRPSWPYGRGKGDLEFPVPGNVRDLLPVTGPE
jgi:hypothetical protein